MGFLSNLWNTAKGIAEITKQTSDELREIATDGFKEIVIKGNSDYKTSYEKRDEANQIVASAESSFRNVVDDVMSVYNNVKKSVEDHYKYKKSIFEKVTKEYAPSVVRFSAYVQQKKLDTSSKAFSIGNSSISTFQPMQNFVGSSGFNLLGDFLLQRKRVAEADQMLEEAKEYRAKIRMESEKLRSIKANLTLIDKHLKEERSLLKRLTSPIEKAISNMKNIEGKTSISQKELEESEQLIEVFNLFEKILITRFVKDDGQITQEYTLVYRQLIDFEKKINNRSI